MYLVEVGFDLCSVYHFPTSALLIKMKIEKIKKINEMFEKAKKGKLDIKELEDYEIQQEINDLDFYLKALQ